MDYKIIRCKHCGRILGYTDKFEKIICDKCNTVGEIEKEYKKDYKNIERKSVSGKIIS